MKTLLIIPFISSDNQRLTSLTDKETRDMSTPQNGIGHLQQTGHMTGNW